MFKPVHEHPTLCLSSAIAQLVSSVSSQLQVVVVLLGVFDSWLQVFDLSQSKLKPVWRVICKEWRDKFEMKPSWCCLCFFQTYWIVLIVCTAFILIFWTYVMHAMQLCPPLNVLGSIDVIRLHGAPTVKISVQFLLHRSACCYKITVMIYLCHRNQNWHNSTTKYHMQPCKVPAFSL